jgi:uncharacterized protein YchJ
MKQEPEWIDVLALVAMHSLMQTAPKNARVEDIAYYAYEQAEAMMEVKSKFTSEGESDG